MMSTDVENPNIQNFDISIMTELDMENMKETKKVSSYKFQKIWIQFGLRILVVVLIFAGLIVTMAGGVLPVYQIDCVWDIGF